MTIDSNILPLTFNHVALPPRFPGTQDGKVEDVERGLLFRLLAASRKVKDCAVNEDLLVWQGIKESLQTCGLVNENRYVNRLALVDAFHELVEPRTIILRIAEQNFGRLIRPFW